MRRNKIGGRNDSAAFLRVKQRRRLRINQPKSGSAEPDGQIMLLTIREALATDGHLTNKQTTFHMGHVYRECNCSSASSLQTDGLRLFEDDGIRLGIDEFQTSLTCEGLLCSTEDTGGDGGLVAIAQETRHVGLYHHILLGHGLIGE